MASAIHRSFKFSLIHRMYYPSLLLLIKDKKCASSISSIKESKYYIQRKTSVDRVILQSFVEQNSCSALMSSSQLIKKCHSYYSISILILKIYHIIVKMFISTWNHTHTEICIFRSFGWKHNFKVEKKFDFDAYWKSTSAKKRWKARPRGKFAKVKVKVKKRTQTVY